MPMKLGTMESTYIFANEHLSPVFQKNPFYTNKPSDFMHNSATLKDQHNLNNTNQRDTQNYFTYNDPIDILSNNRVEISKNLTRKSFNCLNMLSSGSLTCPVYNVNSISDSTIIEDKCHVNKLSLDCEELNDSLNFLTSDSFSEEDIFYRFYDYANGNTNRLRKEPRFSNSELDGSNSIDEKNYSFSKSDKFSEIKNPSFLSPEYSPESNKFSRLESASETKLNKQIVFEHSFPSNTNMQDKKIPHSHIDNRLIDHKENDTSLANLSENSANSEHEPLSNTRLSSGLRAKNNSESAYVVESDYYHKLQNNIGKSYMSHKYSDLVDIDYFSRKNMTDYNLNNCSAPISSKISNIVNEPCKSDKNILKQIASDDKDQPKNVDKFVINLEEKKVTKNTEFLNIESTGKINKKVSDTTLHDKIQENFKTSTDETRTSITKSNNYRSYLTVDDLGSDVFTEYQSPTDSPIIKKDSLYNMPYISDLISPELSNADITRQIRLQRPSLQDSKYLISDSEPSNSSESYKIVCDSQNNSKGKDNTNLYYTDLPEEFNMSSDSEWETSDINSTPTEIDSVNVENKSQQNDSDTSVITDNDLNRQISSRNQTGNEGSLDTDFNQTLQYHSEPLDSEVKHDSDIPKPSSFDKRTREINVSLDVAPMSSCQWIPSLSSDNDIQMSDILSESGDGNSSSLFVNSQSNLEFSYSPTIDLIISSSGSKMNEIKNKLSVASFLKLQMKSPSISTFNSINTNQVISKVLAMNDKSHQIISPITLSNEPANKTRSQTAYENTPSSRCLRSSLGTSTTDVLLVPELLELIDKTNFRTKTETEEQNEYEHPEPNNQSQTISIDQVDFFNKLPESQQSYFSTIKVEGKNQHNEISLVSESFMAGEISNKLLNEHDTINSDLINQKDHECRSMKNDISIDTNGNLVIKEFINIENLLPNRVIPREDSIELNVCDNIGNLKNMALAETLLTIHNYNDKSEMCLMECVDIVDQECQSRNNESILEKKHYEVSSESSQKIDLFVTQYIDFSSDSEDISIQQLVSSSNSTILKNEDIGTYTSIESFITPGVTEMRNDNKQNQNIKTETENVEENKLNYDNESASLFSNNTDMNFCQNILTELVFNLENNDSDSNNERIYNTYEDKSDDGTSSSSDDINLQDLLSLLLNCGDEEVEFISFVPENNQSQAIEVYQQPSNEKDDLSNTSLLSISKKIDALQNNVSQNFLLLNQKLDLVIKSMGTLTYIVLNSKEKLEKSSSNSPLLSKENSATSVNKEAYASISEVVDQKFSSETNNDSSSNLKQIYCRQYDLFSDKSERTTLNNIKHNIVQEINMNQSNQCIQKNDSYSLQMTDLSFDNSDRDKPSDLDSQNSCNGLTISSDNTYISNFFEREVFLLHDKNNSNIRSNSQVTSPNYFKMKKSLDTVLSTSRTNSPDDVCVEMTPESSKSSIDFIGYDFNQHLYISDNLAFHSLAEASSDCNVSEKATTQVLSQNIQSQINDHELINHKDHNLVNLPLKNESKSSKNKEDIFSNEKLYHSETYIKSPTNISSNNENEQESLNIHGNHENNLDFKPFNEKLLSVNRMSIENTLSNDPVFKPSIKKCTASLQNSEINNNFKNDKYSFKILSSNVAEYIDFQDDIKFDCPEFLYESLNTYMNKEREITLDPEKSLESDMIKSSTDNNSAYNISESDNTRIRCNNQQTDVIVNKSLCTESIPMEVTKKISTYNEQDNFRELGFNRFHENSNSSSVSTDDSHIELIDYNSTCSDCTTLPRQNSVLSYSTKNSNSSLPDFASSVIMSCDYVMSNEEYVASVYNHVDSLMSTNNKIPTTSSYENDYISNKPLRSQGFLYPNRKNIELGIRNCKNN